MKVNHQRAPQMLPQTARQAASPGTATRRYLDAVANRPARPIDWNASPARYKRYPRAARTVLEDGWWPAELLRGLLGLTRIGWAHPHDETGRPVPGHRYVTTRRPAPSGGALYPIEAYAAFGRAICHYDVAHHALERLRDGDHRQALTGGAQPDLVLALSTVFWRSGFKYDDFAYRIQCQEVGALAAQAFALADPLGLNAGLLIDFDAPAADRLLGLDPDREATLAILTFTAPNTAAADRAVASGRLAAPAGPTEADPPPSISTRLPYLAALHAATRRPPPEPAAPWDWDPPTPPPPTGPLVALPGTGPVRTADGIGHRTSPLNGFRPTPISARQLAQILTTISADALTWPPATAPYVLALNVTGIPSGAYRYRPDQHALIQVTGAGALTGALTAGPLHLGTRAALRTAAAVLVPVGDPLARAARIGDLWYRLQQTETGLVVHRAALAATALGLTARIHSDGTNPATDATLGLTGTPWRSLSYLLLGTPRTSQPVLPLHRPAHPNPATKNEPEGR